MRPSVIFAVNGWSPYPGQVLGGVDEGDVGEGLRKVADQTLGLGVVFLGQEANIVTKTTEFEVSKHHFPYFLADEDPQLSGVTVYLKPKGKD